MAKDAWEKLHDLFKRYTRNTEVRRDIEVVAHGTDRGVELILWDLGNGGPLEPKRIKASTQRNVSTMRELAKALTDACDFVEGVNPQWAERGKRIHEEGVVRA